MIDWSFVKDLVRDLPIRYHRVMYDIIEIAKETIEETDFRACVGETIVDALKEAIAEAKER